MKNVFLLVMLCSTFGTFNQLIASAGAVALDFYIRPTTPYPKAEKRSSILDTLKKQKLNVENAKQFELFYPQNQSAVISHELTNLKPRILPRQGFGQEAKTESRFEALQRIRARQVLKNCALNSITSSPVTITGSLTPTAELNDCKY
jgi:hypothetical protein